MDKTEQPKNPFTKETINEKWKNCNLGLTEDNKLIFCQEFFLYGISPVNQAYKGFRMIELKNIIFTTDLSPDIIRI